MSEWSWLARSLPVPTDQLVPVAACERKNAEAVRLLVQHHADTNHRCNRGWTALHESVSRNDMEVMEILVSGGAKVESKNAYGITPLFVAAQSGQLEALRFLAKHGECLRVHGLCSPAGTQPEVQESSWGSAVVQGACLWQCHVEKDAELLSQLHGVLSGNPRDDCTSAQTQDVVQGPHICHLHASPTSSFCK